MRRTPTLLVAASLTVLSACPSSTEPGGTGQTGDEGPQWPSIASELPRELAPDATEAERAALVDSQQQLALDLYHLLANDRPGEGYAVSAFSIQSAFGMLYGGTVNQAKVEMKATMHFTLDDERQQVALNWQDLELAKRNLDAVEIPDQEQDPVILRTANGVWIERDFEDSVVPAYLDLLALNYGAGIYLAEFAAKPEAERGSINKWVELRTNGLIPELFAKGLITGATTAVLVNALYLKAPWVTTFDKGATMKQDFNLEDGGTKSVDMMYEYALDARYGESASYTALGIPLRGGSLEMVFVLPEADLASFEAEFDQPTLDALLDDMSSETVSTHIPRFELETEIDLTGPLQGVLGMPSPFEDPSSFDGIVTNLGVITGVVHQTVIKVAEDGVEAAAATGIVIDVTSAEPEPSFEFRADRPFVVMIYDRPTDTVLFLGRVHDPSA